MRFFGFCIRNRVSSLVEPLTDLNGGEWKDNDAAEQSLDRGSLFHRESIERADRAVYLSQQRILLLHEPHQQYSLTQNAAVPEPNTDHELLVRVKYIGLNPIDWKAP